MLKHTRPELEPPCAEPACSALRAIGLTWWNKHPSYIYTSDISFQISCWASNKSIFLRDPYCLSNPVSKLLCFPIAPIPYLQLSFSLPFLTCCQVLRAIQGSQTFPDTGIFINLPSFTFVSTDFWTVSLSTPTATCSSLMSHMEVLASESQLIPC